MPVAKGLGTTGASSGECGHIAVFKTVLEIGAEHEFVREAGVDYCRPRRRYPQAEPTRKA